MTPLSAAILAAAVLVLALTSAGLRAAVRRPSERRIERRLAAANARVDELTLANQMLRAELHTALREADARPRSLAAVVRDPRTRPLPRFVRHHVTPTRIARES